jgi:hypothetical protein
MSGKLFASPFVLSMTRFQSLLACSQAAIFHRHEGVFLDVADPELLRLDFSHFAPSQTVAVIDFVRLGNREIAAMPVVLGIE